MRIYSDNEIEFWGEVFTACRLYAEGVQFEGFLAEPELILSRFGMSDALEVMASGYLPLLPRQARVRRAVDGISPICESVNGQVIPLLPSPKRYGALVQDFRQVAA